MIIDAPGRGCLDTLAGLLVAFALFALAVSVLLFILLIFAVAVAIFLLLRLVFRRIVLPQFYPATAVFAQQRLFGAPPDSQLFSAYDYWLLCLERATRLPFTRTPGQLMIGSILVSLAPTLVVGVPLSLAAPGVGHTVLPGLLLFGVFFGTFTGYRLGQPATGWFQSLSSGGTVGDERPGGFTLGDEDW